MRAQAILAVLAACLVLAGTAMAAQMRSFIIVSLRAAGSSRRQGGSSSANSAGDSAGASYGSSAAGYALTCLRDAVQRVELVSALIGILLANSTESIHLLQVLH